MFKKKLDLNAIIRKIKVICNDGVTLIEESNEYTNVDAVSYLIGMTIGKHATMPTAPVPLAKAWFSAEQGLEARSLISAINEGVLINVNLAYEAACTMFEMRYKVCFPEDVPITTLFQIARLSLDDPNYTPRSDLMLSAECSEPLTDLFNALDTEITLIKSSGGE